MKKLLMTLETFAENGGRSQKIVIITSTPDFCTTLFIDTSCEVHFSLYLCVSLDESPRRCTRSNDEGSFVVRQIEVRQLGEVLHVVELGHLDGGDQVGDATDFHDSGLAADALNASINFK
jgi:hypothetical protein